MEATIKNQRKEIMSPETTFNRYSYKLKAKQFKDRNDERWHYRNYRTEEFLIHFLQDGQHKVARGHFIIRGGDGSWHVEGVGFTAYRESYRTRPFCDLEADVDAPQFMDAELFRNNERYFDKETTLYSADTLKVVKERIVRDLDIIDGELTFVGGVFNFVNDGNTEACPHLYHRARDGEMTGKEYVDHMFGDDLSGLQDMKAIAYLDDETMDKLEFTNRLPNGNIKTWSWGVKEGETLDSKDYSNIVWTYNRHIANKRSSNLPERFDALRAAQGRGLSHPVQLLNIDIPKVKIYGMAETATAIHGHYVDMYNPRRNEGFETDNLN
jgi:hypothetical protein